MYILIISVLALSHLQAQKLTGTIIGTSDNFDYTTYSCSRAVNTPPNVFDGNLNTFLAGCNRSYVWAGLDLGEPHVITEIAYCPRVEMQERLVLGVFEGANNPDFGDAASRCGSSHMVDFHTRKNTDPANSNKLGRTAPIKPNQTKIKRT